MCLDGSDGVNAVQTPESSEKHTRQNTKFQTTFGTIMFFSLVAVIRGVSENYLYSKAPGSK